MSVTSLKTPQTPHRDADPLRTALAQAIEQAREARESVENHRAAIEKTRIAVREAERAVKAAEAGIQTARENHAAALADAAGSDAAPPASGMRRARQAVEDAGDHLESSKLALAQLKQELPLWEGAAREAGIKVEETISLILAPCAKRLLERCRDLVRPAAKARLALIDFANDQPSSAGAGADFLAVSRGLKPLDAVLEEITNFLANIWRDDVGRDDAAPWAARVRAALRENAQAPLPEF